MANVLSLAEKFAKVIDSLYKEKALTAGLEANNAFVRGFDEAGTVQVMNMILNGLGNYDRDTGFPAGKITTTWDPYTIDQDRGMEFDVDSMDDEESMLMIFSNLAKEFMEQHTIPEIDAYRFAKMATLAGTSVEADLTTATVLPAMDLAVNTMDDDEVSQEGRKWYVSNEIYRLLKNADQLDRTMETTSGGRAVSRVVDSLDGVPVVKVVRPRFYTEITLEDGTGDVWGYSKTAVTGRNLNFLLVHEPSVNAITRHAKVRNFDADTNQVKDANLFQYRLYHDLIVLNNKVNGIYAHNAAV